MVEETSLAARGGVLPVVGVTGGEADGAVAYALHTTFEDHGGAPVVHRTGGVRIWAFERTAQAVRAACAARRLLHQAGTKGPKLALDLGTSADEAGAPLAALLDQAADDEVVVSRLAALVVYDVLPKTARLVERVGGKVFVLTDSAA